MVIDKNSKYFFF